MAEKDFTNGARSVKANVIGSDSFSVTVNFKWLLQLFIAVGSVVYAFYMFQMKIDGMSAQIEQNKTELHELLELHEKESEAQMAQMEETIKWYEQELVKVGKVSLNPFSWKSKKKQ